MKNCMKSITASEIPSHKSHYVYILRCADDTYYTGYTTVLLRRMQAHNEGKGAKYTRGRGPVDLMYMEEGTSRSWALRREESIKRLPREKKESLIREGAPDEGGASANGDRLDKRETSPEQPDERHSLAASETEKGGHTPE